MRVCLNMLLFVGVCVRAAVFSCKCVSRLYGQVTHRCDPFSASPDPRPQPLCLLWMCPLCLVPYPIILCPCSKNPCLSIVLLTCSIFPIGHNTPIVSLHLWPSFLRFFYPFFPLVCSTFTFFSPYIYPHSFSQSIFTSPWTPFSIFTFLHCSVNYIISSVSYILHSLCTFTFTPS